MKLYDYYRSSAAYRVRIALRLKGLSYDSLSVNLRDGAQRERGYRDTNPQGLVPALEHSGQVISQSLAIINYLDRLYPQPPLLPDDPANRAQVESFVLHIACDMHPLCNLRVLQYLKNELQQGEDRVNAWYRHWMAVGFAGLEAIAREHAGQCCFGDCAGLADICLVPQLYNARRFSCDLSPYPTLTAVDARLQELAAFRDAAPENQADAVG